MADITRRAKRRSQEASDQLSDVADEARDAKDGASPRDDDYYEDERSSSGGRTVTSELKDTVREAAIEVLKPVMRKATTAAAGYAVAKGPGLVRDKVAPRVADAGGATGIAKGITSKGGGIAGSVGGVASGIGSKLSGGRKEGKSPSVTRRGRLPVEEHIDIGVDLETAYDQFTQFEDWPKFMHYVERIEQRDETTLMWQENIWGVRRSWEAEITEQTPCERLVWRSKNGPQTIGVVTFHRLSDNLTRIMITVDFQPQGLFEKTTARISRRALKSDLMRFKAFIEMRDEATGEWRGRIEDGEVVDELDAGEDDETLASEEEGEEPEASEEEDEEFEYVEDEPEAGEDEEPEASEDEEPEASEDEEPEASEDEEPEASEDEEPEASEDEEYVEEEPEPAPKPRRRRKPAARPRSRSRS